MANRMKLKHGTPAEKHNGPLLRVNELRNGCVSEDELRWICGACKIVPSGSDVLEFGTYDGITSDNMAMMHKGMTFTVDLPKNIDRLNQHDYAKDDWDVIVRRKNERSKPAQSIVNIELDSRKLFEPHWIVILECNIRFVFVDGGHTRDTIACDTLNAYRMCRPGGIIMWHDYANRCWPDVTEWLEEFNHIMGGRLRHIPQTSLAFMVA